MFGTAYIYSLFHDP